MAGTGHGISLLKIISDAARECRHRAAGSLPLRCSLTAAIKRARRVAHLLLEILVLVELVMARRIRLVIADVAVDAAPGGRPGSVPCRVSQSVSDAPQILGARRIAVHDDREQPAREMPRIVPALELESPSPPRHSCHASRSDRDCRRRRRRAGRSSASSTLGAWYQLTGVTIMMPCAATHRG